MIPERSNDVIIDLRSGANRSSRCLSDNQSVEPIALFDESRDPEKARIVEAASAVLGRNGWDCLKVERVLVQARLSTRSFYRHFANKNELLVVMLDHDTRYLVDWLDTVVADIDSPVDQLDTWVTELITVGSGATSRSHARFFVSQWWDLRHEFPDAARASEQRIVDSLEAIISRGVSEGYFQSEDPELDARIIQGTVTSQLANLVCSGRDASQLDTSTIIDFALRSLGSVRASSHEVLELR